MLKYIVLPALLGLAACASHPVPVARAPKPELLEKAPCQAPAIPSSTPTRQEIDAGWVGAVQSALCFEAKFDGLVDFEKGGK